MIQTKKKSVLISLASFACSLVLAASMQPATAASSVQKFSGTDDSVITIPTLKVPVIVTASYIGSENFIVHPVYSSGREGYSWMNEIGDWNGTIFQEADRAGFAAISVKTVGDWTIQIAPLASAPVVNPKQYTGHGMQVIKFAKPSSGLKKISLTHAGEANFIVHPINAKGGQGFSMINEIADYHGSVLLPSGTQYLAIVADGEWTISVK